jgi:hypothetical protein
MLASRFLVNSARLGSALTHIQCPLGHQSQGADFETIRTSCLRDPTSELPRRTMSTF